jgi:hypothetical protein
MLGSELTQWFQVGIADAQAISILLQEKPHFCCGGGIFQEPSISDYFVQVEILDRFQRTPNFLPAAAQIGSVENVDQGPFQARYSDRKPGAVELPHARRLNRASYRLN